MKPAYPVTSDTITDEQIRELLDDLIVQYRKQARELNHLNEHLITCEQALAGYFGDARARCAKLFNARTGR